MKLVVTLFSIDAIRALTLDHDMIELRAENLPSLDLHALRASTTKPIILTHRGVSHDATEAAIEAGIDFVDIEWPNPVTHPERTIYSHHDYEGMRDVEAIWTQMLAAGCAHTKLAATPQNFADNERLLALRGGSVIGMGERGLYSRILAPFRGSELTFVAGGEVAAPGQLTLDRALAIYGPQRADLRADKVFAIAGNPAGHSLSPTIHNALFREKGVSAAYTIASIESFDEITDAFLRGEPCGLSVTAPFKEDAFRFAQRAGMEIGENARRAGAVNTLIPNFADNTDVDGFAALLPRANNAAVIGAGGTARAAIVALENAGIAFTVFNRTVGKLGARPLDELRHFNGDLIINTLPVPMEIDINPGVTYIEAKYGQQPASSGQRLLHAQAKRQHELFMRVFQ